MPLTRQPSTGGRLVYAVGDSHGCLGAFRALVGEIREDAERSRTAERPLLVLLGDYVDRGPDSRGVVEAVMALQDRADFEVVALRGNHEDALLRFLTDPGFARSWIANWGRETLQAYGVEPPHAFGDDEACQRVQARFAEAFPAAHRAFLDDLAIRHLVGDYLFVHAGVRPGVALELQAERDLMWIRHDFLESEADFGKVVVHGHTPSERPELRRNRIGIDTGVYYSGVLTAVRLEGADRRILQGRGG